LVVSTAALISGTTPNGATEAFVAAINGADLEVAVGCLTREACLITPDSTAVRGRAEIRGVLAQMIAQRLEIEVSASSAIAAGEIAHLKQQWRIQVGTDSARPYTRDVNPLCVLQRVEARWKLAIVAPWGLPR
jgi:ketosteroid isomerase-like protein